MMYSLVLIIAAAVVANGKIYQPCDLAEELVNKYQIPRDEVAMWVCIAYHESRYNTSALNLYNWDGSKDHGIFQLNNRYWCHPGTECNLSCDRLLDDDIADDVACAKTVYKQTASFSGDGFSAWAVYHKCRDGAANEYVSNCIF